MRYRGTTGRFRVSLLGLEPQSHLSAADHEYIVVPFYSSSASPNEAFALRQCNPALRRGVPREWRNPVMLLNGAKNDRLGLGRRIRFTSQHFHALDSDLGNSGRGQT
jgi:hypothetical protein